MSKYVIDSSTLTNIADAIRSKDGSTDLIQVSNLASAILNIPSGGGMEGIEVGSFTPYEDMTIMTSSKTEAPTHNPYQIEHHLGKSPFLFLMAINNDVTKPANTVDFSYYFRVPATTAPNVFLHSSKVSRVNGSTNSTGISSDVYGSQVEGSVSVYVDENNILVGDKDGATTTVQSFILRAGRTYTWVALAEG